jgi:hypothetical protein
VIRGGLPIEGGHTQHGNQNGGLFHEGAIWVVLCSQGEQ